MLAANINVQDINGAHWRRFLSLLSHPLPSVGSHPARLPVVLFLEDNKVIKALRIGEGPLAGVVWGGPSEISQLRRELGASWVLALEISALSSLMQEFESQWRFGQDYLTDGLLFAQILRTRFDDGIYLYPRPLGQLPLPPVEVWRRLSEVLLPDGTCAAFYLFDGPSLWTSVIIGKDKGELDLLTTHSALKPAPPIDDWRRDARALSAAISSQLRPLHIGLFAERDVWLSLLSSGSRTAFASAVAEGRVLMDPAPSWLRVLLGVGRVVEVISREVEKRAGPLGGLFGRGFALGEALIGRAADAVGLSSDKLDPAREFLSRALGFDPFAPDSPLRFLAALFRREPQSPQPQSPDRR